MYDALTSVLKDQDFTVVEEFMLPGRDPVFATIPELLAGSKLGDHLTDILGGTGQLWRHQSAAITCFLQGDNVVVSTGTASGKSLIFRTAAFHRVLADPEARVAVFYPLKALANDQYKEWRRWANTLLGDPNAVGRIDGSVSYPKRDQILERARIVLMTPDVCHAWMMSNLASPAVKEFLRHLELVVLDEAHTLEGVFGSNFAFLFRRLYAVRRVVYDDPATDNGFQVMATTATILDAPGHLKDLTGLSFVEIDSSVDGSPEYGRRVLHVAAPVGEEMSLARKLQVALLSKKSEGSFITFVDSRKGVEQLAYSTNKQVGDVMPGKGVLPYRAGLAAQDREDIETALREDRLRGVISTSALELGIDLPGLRVGLNIGVPSTRKAFRQRLGRIGRTGQGAFVVIAPPLDFTRFGTSLKDFYDRSVEPSYLYLNNRFMQFAHGRCLADELESLAAKDKSKIPTKSMWPDDFDSIYKMAKPGGDRPPEFDAVAMLGGDQPQRSYPLRNVAEVNFKVVQGNNASALGEATLPQALRECYPGATYFYMAAKYEVQAWRTTGFEPSIRVKASFRARATRPRIRTWINATLGSHGVVDHHIRKHEGGYLTECEMLITEKVEGFEKGGDFHSYADLREQNPNMKPKHRQFRTTGVLLCVRTPWFREKGKKAQLAESLLDMFCREYSILPQDAGSSSTNISVRSPDGDVQRTDCVAIFDQTYGSLRLTERLYLEFPAILERMLSGARIEAGEKTTNWVKFLENLIEFETDLKEESGLSTFVDEGTPEDGALRRVYAPGSKVGLRQKGMLLTDVELIMPVLLPDGKFMYQAKFYTNRHMQSPVTRWVNPDMLETLGDDSEWSYAMWDPNTQQVVEIEEN